MATVAPSLATAPGVAHALWERIEEERKSRGWSKDEFAERAGLSRVLIENLRTTARVPHPRIVQALAGALELDPTEIAMIAGIRALPEDPEVVGSGVGQAIRDAEGGEVIFLARPAHRPLTLAPTEDNIFIPRSLIANGTETVRLVLAHMSSTDAAAFLREFVEVCQQAADEGDSAALEAFFAAWRHTAEVCADADLFAALTQPINGDLGPVPEPSAG